MLFSSLSCSKVSPQTLLLLLLVADQSAFEAAAENPLIMQWMSNRSESQLLDLVGSILADSTLAILHADVLGLVKRLASAPAAGGADAESHVRSLVVLFIKNEEIMSCVFVPRSELLGGASFSCILAQQATCSSKPSQLQWLETKKRLARHCVLRCCLA